MSEEKKYTAMQEAFLEALCGSARGNIREAMDIAGYSTNTRINEVVGPLRDEIVDRASMVLAMNAPKATYSMVDVLNDPGLVKKEQIEIKGPEGGVFILPPKQVTPTDDEDE